MWWWRQTSLLLAQALHRRLPHQYQDELLLLRILAALLTLICLVEAGLLVLAYSLLG